jgi:TusE/DsrC/DsvC family sulfur relay protein
MNKILTEDRDESSTCCIKQRNMKCFDPTTTRSITLESKTYLLGDKYYLKNFDDWDEYIRDWLSQKEGTELTFEHLIVIDFLRKSFGSNNRHPAVRMVTTELNNQLGAGKGSVRYFHTLFPGGIHQAFLIAGLPMMDSCC